MPEPIALSDLRRKTILVDINSGENGVKVFGLTARQICDHLERFPILSRLSIGGNVSPEEALRATPGALAAWIASACGQHQDEAAEEAAELHLTVEDATNIVQESMLLTFSRGFGPFAARVGALTAHLTVNPSRVPATTSPTPSQPSEPSKMNGSGITPPASSPPTSSLATEDA
jgi:hypothetical protein